MKALYIFVRIMLGIYVGGATAVLIMTDSDFEQEAVPWILMSLFLFFAGIGVAAGAFLANKLHACLYRQQVRRHRVLIPLVIVGAVPALVTCVFSSPLNHSIPPSDARLIAEFPKRKALMEKIPPAVNFTYWSAAPFNDVWQARKGYAYFETPPPNLRPSLDTIPLDQAPTMTVYRHIEGNWYIYLHATLSSYSLP